MTADMGYEPRTRTMKATDQEDIQEVIVVQARTRESRYIRNKVVYKNTQVITTPTSTISELKSGAEQRVGNREENTIRMTILTAARSNISGTELGLDREVDTIQMTTKMTTATSS
jgi:hypothetical protein